MKKFDRPFTEEEVEILRGSFARIGRKHQTSGIYVGLIASGERGANSEKAKAILKDLKELLKLLK